MKFNCKVVYSLGAYVAHQYLIGRQLVFDGRAFIVALLQANAATQFIDNLHPEACL